MSCSEFSSAKNVSDWERDIIANFILHVGPCKDTCKENEPPSDACLACLGKFADCYKCLQTHADASNEQVYHLCGSKTFSPSTPDTSASPTTPLTPASKSSGSLNWKWIILIVLLSILFLVTVGYFGNSWWKKRKSK